MRFLLVFLSVFVSSTFAQKKQEELGEMNIFRNDFSGAYFYNFYLSQDRTSIDYEQTRKITAISSDNEILSESDKRWRIFSNVLGLLIYQSDLRYNVDFLDPTQPRNILGQDFLAPAKR